MSNDSAFVTRRSLMQGATAGIALLTSPLARAAASPTQPAAIRLPVLGQPTSLFAFTGDYETIRQPLTRQFPNWTGNQSIQVMFDEGTKQSTLFVSSPIAPLQRLHLRWNTPMPQEALVLGDAWERSYGDLGWLPVQAERVLPWYALLNVRDHTFGMGVKTGAASFAFWQVDPKGVSLWLDLRNGGKGVLLGQRRLEAATIVTVTGHEAESAFLVTERLCRSMVEGIAIPPQRGAMPVDTIYGSNDWYYAYGQNTPEGILRDADLIASVAPANGPKPFTVIDDGYQDPKRFPSMDRLAADIRSRGVIPGIWIRPTQARAGTPRNLLLPAAHWRLPGKDLAYDPTIPEALQAIISVAAQACSWGYSLIKHDFTTWELLGQWGSQMGASPTEGDWHFNDRSQTNAEILTSLYRTIRHACGPDRLILGCNTIGHLSTGIFDASRTGDDTSGREWERTRRTGVNTLAFRLPQNGAFYTTDADCVAITPDVPWNKTNQWLCAVASTGTVLLVSPDPRSIGPEQKAALRAAFAQIVAGARAKPSDWLHTRTPANWRENTRSRAYDWIQPEGESPFPIGIQRGPE